MATPYIIFIVFFFSPSYYAIAATFDADDAAVFDAATAFFDTCYYDCQYSRFFVTLPAAYAISRNNKVYGNKYRRRQMNSAV